MDPASSSSTSPIVHPCDYSKEYDKLDTYFEKIKEKKIITKDMRESVLNIIGATNFTTLFIYGYLKRYHYDSNEYINDINDFLIRDVNVRCSPTQKMYRDEKKKEIQEDEVADHIAFSAIIKVIFGLLSSCSSLKLYNVLYTMFIFNSYENFQLLDKTENGKKGTKEKGVITLLKSSYKDFKETGNKKQLKDILSSNLNNMSQERKDFKEIGDWISGIVEYFGPSGSVVGMLDYIVKPLTGSSNEKVITFKNRLVTLTKQKGIEDIRECWREQCSCKGAEESLAEEKLYCALYKDDQYVFCPSFSFKTMSANKLNLQLFTCLCLAKWDNVSSIVNLFTSEEK